MSVKVIASSIEGDTFWVVENPDDFDQENHARLVVITDDESGATSVEWWGNPNTTLNMCHFAWSLAIQQGVDIPESYRSKIRNPLNFQK